MRCVIMFALFFCPIASVCAAEARQAVVEGGSNEIQTKPESALLQAEKALRSALSDLGQEVTFEYAEHSQSLTVKYRSRKFMVHGGSKTGGFAENPQEVEGPDVDGFLLRIHAQDKGTVNQADVPQTIREPYWQTQLDVAVVSGTDRQLDWGLSYGTRTDRGLLKTIEDVLAGLESTTTPQTAAAPPLGATTVKPYEPEISLFESVKTVRQYLETKARADYSDKYLHGVSLHFSQGHPRKGACWLYHFAFKQPRLGGDVSIYHFLDGEIVEFNHGP